MDYYAQIDADGRVLGFYAREIHGEAIPAGAIPISAETHASWLLDTSRQRWDGSALVPYTPPVVVTVPRQITRRQLLLALAGAGLITGAEALAAATTGAVPARIDKVFGALPADQALAARITWATMAVAEREHPLIGALVAAKLATAAEVDALFTSAATL